MPRKHFRKYLPSHDSIRNHRFLSRFGGLQHPNLWHLNRHSVARGVGVGMFSGMLPPPFQMLSAAIIAVPLHGNLPVAVLTTLYTNPLTFGPLYLLAYFIGKAVMGGDGGLAPPPEFSWSAIVPWLEALWQWAVSLGKPLVAGILILAVMLAFAGWAAVHAGWRLYVVMAWKRRCVRRQASSGRSTPS